ncbi:MAG TPA: hypothetical protein VNO52_04120, partial [Methylomirabilota bacterium]|nr:hypothetical protein [Methylomirabilota bacterium]
MPVEPAPRRRTTLRVGLAGAPAGPVTAFLRGAPCWLLLCALVSAPWVYGSTRPWSVRLLDWQLGIALAGWVISCLARREWPRIHPVLVGAAGLLLLQGWWMTLNAKFVFDEHLNYTPIEPWVDWAPGTVNQAVSWPNVVNLSLMLGVVCCAADLGRTPQWRKRIWLTLALTGISIVVFGLVQKLTRAPGLYWRDEGFLPTFFGPFRYHANAGAFINLVSPLVAG